jgi:hypothetical protein
MMPWKVEKRRSLIAYLGERGLLEEGCFGNLPRRGSEPGRKEAPERTPERAPNFATDGKREPFRDTQRQLDL